MLGVGNINLKLYHNLLQYLATSDNTIEQYVFGCESHWHVAFTTNIVITNYKPGHQIPNKIQIKHVENKKDINSIFFFASFTYYGKRSVYKYLITQLYFLYCIIDNIVLLGRKKKNIYTHTHWVSKLENKL